MDKKDQNKKAEGALYSLKKLRDWPELSKRAAEWFSEKWDIPVSAYEESMGQCLDKKGAIPQWYLVLDQEERIAAGAGVIENDFHNRRDLTPNLCALFVEERCRRQGLAAELLRAVQQDLKGMGLERLYLVTDHTEFYEKCGWEFLTMVEDEEGQPERMYKAVL